MYKQGDVVKCISDDYSFISEGREYVVQQDQGTSSQIVILERDGDKQPYPASDFELVRSAVVAAGTSVRFERIGEIGSLTINAILPQAKVQAILNVLYG